MHPGIRSARVRGSVGNIQRGTGPENGWQRLRWKIMINHEIFSNLGGVQFLRIPDI